MSIDNIATLVAFLVGMNIVSQLYMIRKDKDKVTKRDYVKFSIEALFITFEFLVIYFAFTSLASMKGL